MSVTARAHSLKAQPLAERKFITRQPGKEPSAILKSTNQLLQLEFVRKRTKGREQRQELIGQPRRLILTLFTQAQARYMPLLM